MARFIGDYEVIKELGSGHFGTVYLCAGETPGRRGLPGKRRLVAVKRLRDDTDEASVAELLQEFDLLDQVKHRCIVRVFEYIEEENAVAMEYIHGLSLRQIMEQLDKAREQVFTEAAVEIACELADALYQANTTPGDNGEPLRLVHRDLKPENVMMTPSGEVKILDFGLARVDNAEFAADDPDAIKGTPIYMAPEQARGEEVDHRTDLFALGLILYELLMNEPAYTVPSRSKDPLGDVFKAIEAGDLSKQCADLESRLPGIGPIAARLLQRRPAGRYNNGQDALVDLRRQLYRDRGSYMKEFCEFFFGSICDIGQAPSLESTQAQGRAWAGRGGGAAGTSSRGRKSIEERLKESMSRQKAGVPAAAGPTSPAAPGAGSDESSARRSSRTPSEASSGRASKGDSMAGGRRGDGGGRNIKRPPVGGGASPKVETFNPAPKKPAAPKKMPGARNPNEAGMLEMVPLSSDADEAEANDDPSATQFFAIPAPKAERAKGGAPPMAPPMGGAAPPPPPGPPGVGIGVGAPMGARPPMAGPIAGGGISGPTPTAPQPMVQGPVSSYGGGGASPFQVQGPSPGGPPPGADSGSRVQSIRVFAIIFAVFVLVCMSVLVAVWFTLPKLMGDKEQPEEVATVSKDITGTSGSATKKHAADTGMTEEAPPPTTRSTPRSTGRSGGGGATAATPAPAAPSASPGTLRVTMADPAQATSIEVVCPSGYRNRATLVSGTGSLSGVPAESCTLYFKGGPPAQYQGVKGGSSLNCSIVGTTGVCK